MATQQTKIKLKVQSYTFKVVVEPDFYDNGIPAYHASIPDLPGCFSWVYSVEEALENLEATAKMWIEIKLERGEHIPPASLTTTPHITGNLAKHDVPAGH